MNAFLKSYKTTLFGIAAAALNMLANGTSWKQVLMSTALAGVGIVAKDFDKSHTQP